MVASLGLPGVQASAAADCARKSKSASFSASSFVGMPTCWPHDPRSDPSGNGRNVILLDIDYLMQRTTMGDVLSIVENEPVFSVPGLTFMSSLSDADGNVLHIVPGQGYRYYEKPDHVVLTNFSPFKGNSESHPWMGWDRYLTAEAMLKYAAGGFDVRDCFEVLRATSQEVCPTVVSRSHMAIVSFLSLCLS